MNFTVDEDITITAKGATAAIDCLYVTTLLVSIGGTASTLGVSFQYSNDKSEWHSDEGTSKGNSATTANSTTTKGGWEFDCSLYKWFRLNVTDLESGKNLKVSFTGIDEE